MNSDTPHNPNPNSSSNSGGTTPNPSNPPTDDHQYLTRSMPETSTAADDVAMVDHIFTNLDSFPTSYFFTTTDEEPSIHYQLQKRKPRFVLNIEMGDVDSMFSEHPDAMFENHYNLKKEEGRWHLFSTSFRKVGNGYWNPIKPSTTFSDDNGVKICEKNFLVYYEGCPPTSIMTDWVMIEYTTDVGIISKLFGEKYPKLDNYVICKIYKESDPDVIHGLNLLGSSDEDEIRSSVGSNEDPSDEQVQAVCDQLALLCNQERESDPDAIVNQETDPRTLPAVVVRPPVLPPVHVSDDSDDSVTYPPDSGFCDDDVKDDTAENERTGG